MNVKYRLLFVVLGLVNFVGGFYLLARGKYFISTDRVFNEAWDNEGVFVMILFGAVLLYFGLIKRKRHGDL